MSYYVTNENSFLDIKNAHLRVTGNVHTDVLKLGAIEFQPTGSEVTGTVNFTNVTTGVTTSSNLNVGGTLQLGTVEVVATTHTLANTTAKGNVTPHTIEVSNVTTGLVTTANVEVGRDLVVTGNVSTGKDLTVTGNVAVSSNLTVSDDLTVTGNVAVDTDTLFVDTVNDRVGIGTSEPIAALDVRGGIAVQGIMTTFTSPYISAYPISSISPTVWAVAGDSTARIGGGAISYTSGISIKYLNGVPMWFWGGNDEFVDIRNIIPVNSTTWTIAIAIAKKPETGMVLCNQVNDAETNTMTNHRIVYADGRFNGDEYPPSGGGWNLRNNGDIQIPNESVVVVKKEGNGTGQLFVYLNGHTIGSTTSNETGSGTAHKIRIGRRSRYSGYPVDSGGGIHGGIAAIAAWDSAISQTDMTKYITYQSMTSKN